MKFLLPVLLLLVLASTACVTEDVAKQRENKAYNNGWSNGASDAHRQCNIKIEGIQARHQLEIQKLNENFNQQLDALRQEHSRQIEQQSSASFNDGLLTATIIAAILLATAVLLIGLGIGGTLIVKTLYGD